MFEPIAQQESVRKIGEWVVQRLANESGFSPAAIGHVMHYDGCAKQSSVPVVKRAAVHQESPRLFGAIIISAFCSCSP